MPCTHILGIAIAPAVVLKQSRKMVALRVLRSVISYLVTTMLITTPLIAAISEAEVDRIKGITLRVPLFDLPPFYTIKRHPKGNISAEVEGIVPNLMETITSLYDVSWQFVPVDSTRWTRDGGTSAVIHQLVNNEVDMAFYPFVRNLQNSQLIDISFTINTDENILLQPWPLEESRLTAPVRPFSGVTWIFILISIAFAVFVMALVSFVQSKWAPANKTARALHLQSFPSHVYCWIQYAASIITYQGSHLTYKPESLVRIVAGFWALMMVVLLNAYTGTLTSYLTVPKWEPVINSIDQLVTQTKLKLCIDVESELSQKYLNATSGVDKIIGDYLRDNPELLITSEYFKPIEFITKRTAVYYVSQVYALFMIMHDFKSTSECRMTLPTKSTNDVVHYGYGLPKDSSYKSILNDILLKHWDFGLRNHVVRMYYPNVDNCAFNGKARGKVESLRLRELSGIFALLGIGIGMSFLVFLMEVTYHLISCHHYP